MNSFGSDYGLWGHVRHPQYIGFVAIMFGFLLQWPTLLTLATPRFVPHLSRADRARAVGRH
jgi:hypothetical protein